MEFDDEMIGSHALDRLVAEFERGIEIVGDIDDGMYAASRDGGSSIGAHIRHNLDFVNALLNGIAERRVDYNARARDPKTEMNRDHAIGQLLLSIGRMKSITSEILTRLVVVRSEVDPDIWHTSSVSREIEFLHSHTVHHYALVAWLIGTSGGSVREDLGVAPSTLRYRSGFRQVSRSDHRSTITNY